MKRTLVIVAAAGALMLGAGAAQANDKWETATSGCSNDDTAGGTCNQLLHGATQTHDVQAVSPARDEDWYVVETKARHSYEVRVSSGSTVFQPGSTAAGTTVARLNTAGTTVLTAGIGPDGPLNYGDDAGWVTARWIGGASNERDTIRVQGKGFGNPGANDTYDITFVDTTYFLPRFNNAGGQITVLLIQNTSAAAVSGDIYFYNSAGTLLATQAISVPVGGITTVNSSAIPALAGQSGAATIAHTGGWGALAAKSVALEPATGFSFDTPAVNVPR